VATVIKKRVEDVVATVAAAVKEDRRQTNRGLSSVLGQSKNKITSILSEDLGLVKKVLLLDIQAAE
jgi:hypothetical protein